MKSSDGTTAQKLAYAYLSTDTTVADFIKYGRLMARNAIQHHTPLRVRHGGVCEKVIQQDLACISDCEWFIKMQEFIRRQILALCFHKVCYDDAQLASARNGWRNERTRYAPHFHTHCAAFLAQHRRELECLVVS